MPNQLHAFGGEQTYRSAFPLLQLRLQVQSPIFQDRPRLPTPLGKHMVFGLQCLMASWLQLCSTPTLLQLTWS